VIKKLSIVVPVYNDWASVLILLTRLNEVARKLGPKIFVRLVNDGSSELAGPVLGDLSALTSLQGADIVHLAVNVGHQRAIAIGLCLTAEESDADAVLVMDGDGEDPPEAISELLTHTAKRKEFCIVAQRRKRTEKAAFKVSYVIYKTVFRLVTGNQIGFGNFSLISISYAQRLAMVSDLWNNLAAAILRSRIPFEKVPIDRGHRYAGKSKMNYVSLVVHGMSGISVYAETIFVRLLFFTAFLVMLSISLIAFVAFLRIFYPTYATPGWATTVTFGMVIILMQAFFVTLSSLLVLLNSRVQRLVLPRIDYPPYIASRELIIGSLPIREASIAEPTHEV
jgi:polyisoprenyl-phosphate glycosyltransferase